MCVRGWAADLRQRQPSWGTRMEGGGETLRLLPPSPITLLGHILIFMLDLTAGPQPINFTQSCRTTLSSQLINFPPPTAWRFAAAAAWSAQSRPRHQSQIIKMVRKGKQYTYLQRQLLDVPEQLDVFLCQVLVARKLLVVVAPVAAVLIVCKTRTELRINAGVSELLRRS